MVEKHLPRLPNMSSGKGSKTAIVYRQRTDNWDGSSESQTLTPTRSTSPFQTHLSPYPTPSQSSLRRPGNPPSISSTPSRDQGSLSRKKGLWNKLSTLPSASNHPSSMPSNSMTEFGASFTPIPPSPGLAKKRSSGQLLSNLNRGLSRVGSVVRRSPNSTSPASPTASPRPTPKRQGSKLGLSKQGSIRRQVEHGSWRGRKLTDGPEVVQEEEEEGSGIPSACRGSWQDVRREVDPGDEGIGRPFNVNHDLHISPDLDNLPQEWITQLKAEGMTEGDLLMIASARKRQIEGKHKTGATEGGSAPSFVPLKATPGKSAGPLKTRQSHIQPERRRSSRSSASRSSAKRRLPALTHPDDSRPSIDITPALASGPSRTSSIRPSPPPSAFTSSSRPPPTRRLSDQLRGFASLDLDQVGSWADDVLGVMQQSNGTSRGHKPKALKVYPVTTESGVSDSPRSPKSPGLVKRVPVPTIENDRKRDVKATTTSTSLDVGPDSRSPRTPLGRLDQRKAPEHPMTISGADVMTTPLASNTMAASHSHSQSLSTAEDQDIRTPSTTEHHIQTGIVPPIYPKTEERWRSTEGMAWCAPDDVQTRLASSGDGKLGEAINLAPTKVDPVPVETPSTPPLTSSTYLTLTSPSHPSVSAPREIINADTDFSLSFPSPLRPPPNPHVSLPASASDTDDNFSRPMSFSEIDPDASPILRAGALSIGSDMMSCGSDWGSRKASGASEAVQMGSGDEVGMGRIGGSIDGTDDHPIVSPTNTRPKLDLLPVSHQSGRSENGEDHLSPLPPINSHQPLSHRISARSLTATEKGRESMALSTFSGESDMDYARDSMLGARVYTAQKCEVGRMSVFSLSGYMEEDGEEGKREVRRD